MDKELAAPTSVASLLPRGIPLDALDIQPLATTCWAWRKLNRLYRSGPLYSPALLLAHNPFLPLTTDRGVLATLSKLGLDTFGSLFPDDRARKLSELTQLPGLTGVDSLNVARLQGTLRATFSSFPAPFADFPPLTLLITDDTRFHLVTKLYKACLALRMGRDGEIRRRWELDIGHPLTDKDWAFCLVQTHRVSPNHRHKLLHFKFIHRIYISPNQLATFDPSKQPTCPKCNALAADFAHVTCSCLPILAYWQEVFATLTQIIETPLVPSPELGLLGLVWRIKLCYRRFTAIALLLAKREIAVLW